MGAWFDEEIFDGKLDYSSLEKQFQKHQELCAEENGNSYSGRLNMCPGLNIENKVFCSYTEASDYIQNTAKKWDNAIAVRYKESNPVKDTVKIKAYKAKLDLLKNELFAFNFEVNSSIKDKLKSVEFIKCSSCKSHMDTRFYTKTLKCPICDSSFATKKQLNKITLLKTRIGLLEKKIKDAYKVLQNKADKKKRKENWLIGGWCSS